MVPTVAAPVRSKPKRVRILITDLLGRLVGFDFGVASSGDPRQVSGTDPHVSHSCTSLRILG